MEARNLFWHPRPAEPGTAAVAAAEGGGRVGRGSGSGSPPALPQAVGSGQASALKEKDKKRPGSGPVSQSARRLSLKSWIPSWAVPAGSSESSARAGLSESSGRQRATHLKSSSKGSVPSGLAKSPRGSRSSFSRSSFSESSSSDRAGLDRAADSDESDDRAVGSEDPTASHRLLHTRQQHTRQSLSPSPGSPVPGRSGPGSAPGTPGSPSDSITNDPKVLRERLVAAQAELRAYSISADNRLRSCQRELDSLRAAQGAARQQQHHAHGAAATGAARRLEALAGPPLPSPTHRDPSGLSTLRFQSAHCAVQTDPIQVLHSPSPLSPSLSHTRSLSLAPYLPPTALLSLHQPWSSA